MEFYVNKKFIGKKFSILSIIMLILSINVNASEINISDQRIRLMPPNIKMTAGYFSIENKGNEKIKLVSASSSLFDKVELHTMYKDGDAMMMKEVGHVELLPSKKFKFSPMGHHLMLIGPKEVLKEGAVVDVELNFSNSTTIKTNFVVKKISVMKMGGMKMKRPDYAAPVGVKAPKAMMKDSWMFTYKYGHMDMDCCLNDSDKVSHDYIQNTSGYSMAPLRMEMHMHMFGAMYAYSEKNTLMLMIPYIDKEMDMVKYSNGKVITTRSSGLGDLNLVNIFKYSNETSFKLGLSIPIGEFDEKDYNHMSVLKVMPYPMQLGSGTYDLSVGLTYQKMMKEWSYGYNFTAITRFGNNGEGWRYGDRRDLQIWASRPVSKSLSLSIGLDMEDYEEIHGQSANRNGMTPTWNENYHAGTRFTSNIGLNLKIPSLSSTIGLQCGAPIYQDVQGPQMYPDFKCNLGISFMNMSMKM